jgi:ABC-type multidrug transport system fused ATPase/permease subunit
LELEISKNDSDYMYNFVKDIIIQCGPRMPCSEQEAKGSEIIKKQFEKTCDEVYVEQFTCHPKAFLGWIRVIMIMLVLSIIGTIISSVIVIISWNIILSIISFSLAIIAIEIMWEEFFNYHEFIDPIFRKQKSQNVIGSFKNGERKKIIVISAHIDSALQFNLLKILRWGFLIVAFIGILIILFWSAISFINLIIIVIGFYSLSNLFFGISIWTLIIGSPFFIALFFFVPIGDRGNVVPGAVDNLSGCAVLVGISRFLNINPDLIPKDSEIRLIAFGCEEAGLRGAYRYVSSHLNELKEFETHILNLDGLETPDKFHVIEYEPTTRTWHSQEIVEKVLKAAKDANINVKRLGSGKLEKTLGRLSGGSDAAAFSKAGIKATFLNSADWKTRSSYYHQSEDTFDKIKKGTLENALKICLNFIKNE